MRTTSGKHWNDDPEQFGWVPCACRVLTDAYAFIDCSQHDVPFTGIAPPAPLVALASSADILLRLAAAEARANPRGAELHQGFIDAVREDLGGAPDLLEVHPDDDDAPTQAGVPGGGVPPHTSQRAPMCPRALG